MNMENPCDIIYDKISSTFKMTNKKNVYLKDLNETLVEFKSISKIYQSPFKNKLRYRVFSYMGCKCVSCGESGNVFARSVRSDGTERWGVYTKDYIEITLDHIVPLSKGGSRRSIKNLQPMCRKCNSKKADKLIVYNKILDNNFFKKLVYKTKYIIHFFIGYTISSSHKPKPVQPFKEPWNRFGWLNSKGQCWFLSYTESDEYILTLRTPKKIEKNLSLPHYAVKFKA